MKRGSEQTAEDILDQTTTLLFDSDWKCRVAVLLL